MFIVMDRWYKPVTKVADAQEFYRSGWSHQELCSALSGNLVRNSFVEFDLDSTALRKSVIESLAKFDGPFDMPEICDILGLSISRVNAIRKQALDSMRKVMSNKRKVTNGSLS